MRWIEMRDPGIAPRQPEPDNDHHNLDWPAAFDLFMQTLTQFPEARQAIFEKFRELREPPAATTCPRCHAGQNEPIPKNGHRRRPYMRN